MKQFSNLRVVFDLPLYLQLFGQPKEQIRPTKISELVMLKTAQRILLVIWQTFQKQLRHLLLEKNVTAVQLFGHGALINLTKAVAIDGL